MQIPVAEDEWVRPPSDLEAHFRQILTDQCAQKSIEIVPVRQVPTERLLDLSLKRVPPFQGEEGERGLRDVLIVLSLLAHARENRQSEVILISEDKVFEDEKVRDLAIEYGVRLFVYKSVDDFIAYVNAQADEADRKIREEKEKRVRDFLLGEKQVIQEFIEQKAEFPERFLASAGVVGTIRSIVGVWVKDISDVSVLDVESDEEGMGLLFITFGVRLKIALEVEMPWLTLPEPKQYRVGVEPEEPVHGFGFPERQGIVVERGVVCEATAKERIEDSALTTLLLKEVKIPGGFWTLTDAILRGLSARPRKP